MSVMRSMIAVAVSVLALVLCASVLLFAHPARAVVDCRLIPLAIATDPNLRGLTCEEVAVVPIRWRGGVAHMRVLRASDADVERGVNATAWIRETARRAGAALDELGGDYRLGEITVVITALPPVTIGTVTACAFAAHEAGSATCVVPVYPGGAVRTETEYAAEVASASFNFAHEIFHCVQHATWPAASITREASWWMEGSAEFFANVAFPGENWHAAYYVTEFDRRSPDTSLLNMTYENFVLFAWLYESGGAARFRHFLRHVGEAEPHGHRAAAEAALAPEVWQGFAQSYIDQRLHFVGGDPLNSTPVLTPEHDASAETPISLRALPLVLGRASIRVAPGRYRFATTVANGPYASSHEANAWAPLPGTVETECSGDRVIKLAALTMSNDGVQIETRPTREGEAVCSCSAPARSHNSCLVGTWTFPGDGDFCGALTARLAGHAVVLECAPGTGEVTFSRDGTVVSHATGTRAVVQLNPTMSMETTQSVASRARWGTAGDQVDYCDASSVLTGMTTITGPRGPTSLPNTAPTPVQSGSAAFTCTRTTLTIVNREAPGAFLGIGPEMVLTRVR